MNAGPEVGVMSVQQRLKESLAIFKRLGWLKSSTLIRTVVKFSAKGT